jgi:hypothetical protein
MQKILFIILCAISSGSVGYAQAIDPLMIEYDIFFAKLRQSITSIL